MSRPNPQAMGFDRSLLFSSVTKGTSSRRGEGTKVRNNENRREMEKERREGMSLGPHLRDQHARPPSPPFPPNMSPPHELHTTLPSRVESSRSIKASVTGLPSRARTQRMRKAFLPSFRSCGTANPHNFSSPPHRSFMRKPISAKAIPKPIIPRVQLQYTRLATL